MTFKERVKNFGKGIIKAIKVGILTFQLNEATTEFERENYALELELTLADTETEKERIRKAFIARKNQKYGFPTKSVAEQATDQKTTEQRTLSHGIDLAEPPTLAYKEIQDRYSGKNGNGK